MKHPQAGPEAPSRSAAVIRQVESVTSQGTAAPPLQSRPRTWRLVVVISVAVGITLRVLQYATNRSLWLDEALLARALADASFGELLRPGSWGAVPPGFLWTAKASVLVFGTSEYALRLVPMLAGVLSLLLFVSVARRLLTPAAATLATALYAVSPYLIYYSSELKHYSTDAAVTVMLLAYATHLHAKGITPGRALLLGLVGFGAVAFSLAAAFTLGGLLVALLVASFRRRDHGGALALALIGVAWGLVFAAAYFALFDRVSEQSYAQSFWRAGFMPVPPRSAADLIWLPAALARAFREPLGVMDYRNSIYNLLQTAAGTVGFVAGALWLATRQRYRAVLLMIPILLALVGSALRVYPFGSSQLTSGRVLLYLAPAFFLVMAQGAVYLARSSRPLVLRASGFAVILLLVVPPVAEALTLVPYGRTEIKPLLSYLQEHRRPGDIVYVHYDAKAAFRHYREDYGIGNDDYAYGVCARLRPQEYLERLAQLRGSPRVWFLFAGGTGAYGYLEEHLMIRFLNHIGRRVDDRIAVGATLYLYDLRQEQTNPGPFNVQVPTPPATPAEGCEFFDAL